MKAASHSVRSRHCESSVFPDNFIFAAAISFFMIGGLMQE